MLVGPGRTGAVIKRETDDAAGLYNARHLPERDTLIARPQVLQNGTRHYNIEASVGGTPKDLACRPPALQANPTSRHARIQPRHSQIRD